MYINEIKFSKKFDNYLKRNIKEINFSKNKQKFLFSKWNYNKYIGTINFYGNPTIERIKIKLIKNTNILYIPKEESKRLLSENKMCFQFDVKNPRLLFSTD